MKQHYIPRCYLKRFSENEKSINTYDKTTSKSYNAPLMSVCCEEDMYTLSDEYVKRCWEENHQEINNLTIEKEHFARDVEPNYSRFLSDLDTIQDEWLTGKDHYRLSFYEKKELAARLTYMNYDELMKCAGAMANNYFVFWVSKGGDFYTSDFPIAVEPHVPNQGYLYCGLLMYGSEMMMSLSPSLALSIYDRNYHKDKEELDGSFIVADDKEIRRHNMMRYFYAQRHVFSYKNDFRLIEFIHRARGGEHIYMTPYLKAEVVSGLGRY